MDQFNSGCDEVLKREFQVNKKDPGRCQDPFYLNQPFSFDRVMASIRFFTSSFSRIIEI